jgi:ATP phosphoribosyltransferase
MSNTNLVVGLPAGSLADSRRGGNLIDLLKHAGFPAKGYADGGPSSFPLTPFLVGWDGRPQEFGSQLALGEVDVAIGGDDWITERILEGRYLYELPIDIKKVLPLGRGTVRIVIITAAETAQGEGDEWLKKLLTQKPLVTMVSELPYLALDWFQKKAQALGFGDSHMTYSVQKYKTPPQIDKGILIYEPWGKTEAKVTCGAADFAMEITQTGSAIRNYGLAIVDEVMNSEASIWASPTLKNNPEKYELARMFLLNLYGSIHAENKVLVTFNAAKPKVPDLMDYLSQKHLFGDEPTINEGVNFTEFSVELATASPDLPLAKVRYELAKIGATNIETIPLDSSIPGLDVIDL